MTISHNPILTLLEQELEPSIFQKELLRYSYKEHESYFQDIYLHYPQRFIQVLGENHFSVQRLTILHGSQKEPRLVKILLPFLIDNKIQKQVWYRYLRQDNNDVTRTEFLEAYRELTEEQKEVFIQLHLEKINAYGAGEQLEMLLHWCNDEDELFYDVFFHPDAGFLRLSRFDDKIRTMLNKNWTSDKGIQILLVLGQREPQNMKEHEWLANYQITGTMIPPIANDLQETELHM